MGWLPGFNWADTVLADTLGLSTTESNIPLPLALPNLTGKRLHASWNDVQFTDPTDGTTLLDWYLEVKSDTVGVAHLKVPTLTAGQAALSVARMYVGNAAAADLSDEAGTFANGLALRGSHAEASGNIIDSTGGYVGTPSRITYGGTGKVGPALQGTAGGSSTVTWGDVTQLNSVSAFSVSFWLMQPTLDLGHTIFLKLLDTFSQIQITTAVDGLLSCHIRAPGNYAGQQYDYSQWVTAGVFAHLAFVYDGTQAAANRLKLYVDGVYRAPTSSYGAIPTATANLAGYNAVEGVGSSTVVAKLDEFRIASAARSASWVLAEAMAGAGTLFSYGGWVPALDLAGSAYGIGTLGGQAQLVKRLEGSAHGLGMVGGELQVVKRLEGSAYGIGVLGGQAQLVKRLEGSAHGLGVAEGREMYLLRPGPISAELASRNVRFEAAPRMSVDVATRKRVEFVSG